MKKPITSSALKAGEWLAENAYLPPGMHRLLTAAGLSGGLFLGRTAMNAVVARDDATGRHLQRSDVNPLLRPLYDLMPYNAYSDHAADRWKSVVDNMAPLAFGALGAYLGSRHFFYGRMPAIGKTGKPFNPGTFQAVAKTEDALLHGKVAGFTVENADMAANLAQSDATNKLAAANFSIGSSAGTHLFGAFFPLSNGMSAVRFQQVARHINVPGMGWFNRLMGNRSNGSLRYRSALTDLAKWAESNTHMGLEREVWAHDDIRHHFAQNLLQIFRKVTPEEEKNISGMIHEVLEKGHAVKASMLSKNASAPEISKTLKEFYDGQFLGIGLERNLLKHGFKDHLAQARIGDSGPFRLFSRMLGSGKQERAIEGAFRNHLRETFPEHYANYDFGASNVRLNRTHATIAGGAIALTAGAGMWSAHNQHQHRKDWQDKVAGQNTPNTKGVFAPRVAEAQAHQQQEETQKSGNIVEFINGKPLDIVHWLSRVVIIPPSMHRLMSAAYLSAGLWVGMKGANVLAGRSLTLTKASDSFVSLIKKENVWAPLRPLHGLLEYTPNAYTVADRAKQIAHHLIPVVTGAVGTYSGSKMFFADKQTRLKHPEFLEDYAERISMEQSEFYAKATAATSIFNTGSGLHLLPFANYSSNLHNRYLMANGQQVALPGVGSWWSGNPGLYPWGIKKTLHYTARYLAGDDSEFPKQLPALSHAILAKLYPHLPEAQLAEKECALMEAIYKVRDPHLVDHTLPKNTHDIVAQEMTNMLTGAGFEQTLRTIGLKPEEANLASNGTSGKLANRFDTGHAVSKLEEEFKSKTVARSHGELPAPSPVVSVAGIDAERLSPTDPTRQAHRAA